MALSDPPGPDELEVSLFGPGYGESIVVHVGQGTWFIVDSCIDPQSREVMPLVYLRQLGVAVERDVAIILATHWHDDHVRGMGELVAKCESAEFWCSEALHNDEFLTLVEAGQFDPFVESSGVEEFDIVLKTLRGRGSQRMFAVQDRVLREGAGTAPRLLACSPSDAAMERAHGSIARLLPEAKQPKRRIPAPNKNEGAVVLHLEVGDVAILLGADLENDGPAGTGWDAVLGSIVTSRRTAVLFKVPHHGAASAHNDRVWAELLDSDRIAIVAPHVRGSNALPDGADRARICSLSTSAYMTAPVHFPGRRHRERAVERTTESVVGDSLRLADAEPGHVRLRIALDPATGAPEGEWSLEAFGTAHQLC